MSKCTSLVVYTTDDTRFALRENLDWGTSLIHSINIPAPERQTHRLPTTADLLTVDLSLINTPSGKQKLAQTLLEGVREKGFFYVKNFNISQERVDRQFAIGKEFYELPLEEKVKYVPELGEFLVHILSCSEGCVCWCWC